MTVFKKIKEDYRNLNKRQPTIGRCIGRFLLDSGFRAVVLFRIGNHFRKKNVKIFAVLAEKLMHHLCNCWISTNATIDEGFVIRHVGCIVIGSKSIIGKRCDIRQGVTIGGNTGKKDENGNTQPIIGDDVIIGAGAKILGPIQIGNNSIVGANAVVINSFSSNSVIGGVPAKLLRNA